MISGDPSTSQLVYNPVCPQVASIHFVVGPSSVSLRVRYHSSLRLHVQLYPLPARRLLVFQRSGDNVSSKIPAAGTSATSALITPSRSLSAISAAVKRSFTFAPVPVPVPSSLVAPGAPTQRSPALNPGALTFVPLVLPEKLRTPALTRPYVPPPPPPSRPVARVERVEGMNFALPRVGDRSLASSMHAPAKAAPSVIYATAVANANANAASHVSASSDEDEDEDEQSTVLANRRTRIPTRERRARKRTHAEAAAEEAAEARRRLLDARGEAGLWAEALLPTPAPTSAPAKWCARRLGLPIAEGPRAVVRA